MKNLITIIVFGFLFTGSIYAQKTAPKISSLYTNLDKDCRGVGGKDHDEAIDCKGVGGYRIYFSPSAALQTIFAQTKNQEDSIVLANVSFEFKERNRKVEWRMANGKPFAVIMRIDKYSDPGDDNPYIGKKIGEELIIRGLKGFEDISFEVDSKTPNANTKARELADKAYLDKKQ